MHRRVKEKAPAYSPNVAEAKPPPMWMVRLNVAMLRRGLRIGSQRLLSVRGRKSGEVRSTPVSIATIDGKIGSGDPDVVVAGADRYPVFRLDSNQNNP